MPISFCLALVATACGGLAGGAASSVTPQPAPSTTVFFQQQPEANNTFPAALIKGDLVDVDGCIRVNRQFDGTTSYLVIWPPGVRLSAEQGRIEVLDTADQVVARVGAPVSMGGGIISVADKDWLSSQLPAPLPATCPGPFWFAGPANSLEITTPLPQTPQPTRSAVSPKQP